MTTEELQLLPRVPMFIGESKNLVATIRDSDGNPIDLTGSTVYFMGKTAITDDDNDAVLDESVSSFTAPTTGEVEIPVDLTALPDTLLDGTAVLYCDLVVKDPGGKIENYGLFAIELNKGVRDTVP